MVARPLTKEMLKKMFLKVLWEIKRPGGKCPGESWGSDSILASTLPVYFKLKNEDKHTRSDWALTAKERDDAELGIEELQRDGFIRNDPGQKHSSVFKLLTDKGEKCAEQELDSMKLPSIDIAKLLSRDDLLNRVRDDFVNGEFESAIMKAFKQVEEAVRAKAKQAASATGHDLMVAAFAPSRGVLRNPEAQTDSEKQALFLLFDASNGWFRNPSAHRTVGYNDAHEAAQILGFANYLLSVVDKCV